MRARIKKRSGFTLIELLIVVTILSVLASVVVPQFGKSSESSKLVALDSDLASLRTAIDMYTAEHGHYPGSVPSRGTCAVGDNTDTATPGAAAFLAHLTQYTTAEGVACSQSDAKTGGSIRYGPYLRGGRLPVNPLTGSSEIQAIQTGALKLAAYGSDADGGWLYDFAVGRIAANQPGYVDR